MKKVVSLVLVFVLLAAVLAVSFSASYSVTEPEIISYEEALANYAAEHGEVETQRMYFQMPDGNRGGTASKDVIVTKEIKDPETGEVIDHEDIVAIPAGGKAPSWYNDFNIVDGQHVAGAYWYNGSANAEDYGAGWVGYKMGTVDYDQGIFCVDLPLDSMAIIFNNGVNGGMDDTQPIYYEAAQTVDLNPEGAPPEWYDSLPYGSPDPWSFDGCIFIIDPNQIEINAYSGKQSCGGNWYVYYGDGCYGQEYEAGIGDDSEYPDGTPGWTGDIADVCMNPDHFVDGVHVGYHTEDDPTEAPTEEPTDLPEGYYFLGDANNDHVVDINDVVFVQRYDAKINIPCEDTIWQANVDGNKKEDKDVVNIIDATLIQRYDAGKTVNYPIGQSFPYVLIT